ncbi:MAG: hypothetical protein LAN70_08485 [Acidobacteriia bacterium]|jgi:hypothetical protein|nr:hypothetical protein [Terriglobia bacterium]
MSSSAAPKRSVIADGPHTAEILRVLESDLGPDGIRAASEKAARIINLSVDPIAGQPPQPSDGLLYGLIQSGKTSILTVAAAMAVDNGFRCIVILTTDNDPLYDQTLDRVKAALRGLNVLGKRDWRDPARFARQLRTGPFAVVCSKNGSMLHSLLNAFRDARARGLSVLIIDDEADQASLNTKTSSGKGVSRINQVITDFRDYFPVNTYLQVTATPQALFLQRPDHRYRPSFSVISEPGKGYVGGDAFFGSGRASLLRIVDLAEVSNLKAPAQPSPTGALPRGLKKALYTFLVSAAAKVLERPTEGFAFLCHVSVSTRDHAYIVSLIDSFKSNTVATLQAKGSAKHLQLMKDLRDAYDDLFGTDATLAAFDKIVDRIEFYINGANIKLVNARSNDEIKLDSVFNLFVGGNKLGRGVTIKNLLVSYYGRNPRTPNADTVLQHARMYGYREHDLGVTRLFLPQRLADHFTSIHQMETALRDLLQAYPEGCFEGIYVSGSWRPTRRNVLDPNSLGFYVAGSSCNPAYPLRSTAVERDTAWLDSQFSGIGDDEPFQTITIDRVIELTMRCHHDPAHGAQLWNHEALRAALDMQKQMKGNGAYLVLRRGRNLTQPRRESAGILTGGEEALAPRDAVTLFLYRQNRTAAGEAAVWWPQIRFPDGNYVLAFSFDW